MTLYMDIPHHQTKMEKTTILIVDTWEDCSLFIALLHTSFKDFFSKLKLVLPPHNLIFDGMIIISLTKKKKKKIPDKSKIQKWTSEKS